MRKAIAFVIKWVKIIDKWLLDLIYPDMGDDYDDSWIDRNPFL